MAGLTGLYYPTPDLGGDPSFQRRDIRLDFDWGTDRPIGGSVAEPYASFPQDDFSVRWEGQLIPAFSEVYTFRILADDGARLHLRQAGTEDWIPLIDAWSDESGNWVEGVWEMTRGVAYDIRVEYRELSGIAALHLWWEAASFPPEPVETLAEIGWNGTHWDQAFADMVKSARNSWVPYYGMTPGMDAEGWPTTDFQYVFQESLNMGLDVDPITRGTAGFRFQGRGEVSLFGNVDRNSLVSSYDGDSNTTSGTFRITERGSNASYFRVLNSDRDGDFGPDGLPDRDGVTDLRLMIPSAPDSATPSPFDALFVPQLRQAYEYCTVLRVDLNNGNQERFWTDRTRPGFFNQNQGATLERIYSTGSPKANGASWEHRIMLCNETGRDLYINVPHLATGWDTADTESYVYKLALLIRHGSDGVEPYETPVAAPVYPPLNPNLRVYVEYSNEVWNYGSDAFRQYWDIDALVKADADAYLDGDATDPLARPQDFPVINYDNLSTAETNGRYHHLGTWRYRKVMLRTIQISEIFRHVFGDAAMHTRIRPVYEWQYANINGTARIGLEFAEAYFNNGGGNEHVAIPRPVNYYLWGGGGASYYGSSNGWAVTDILPDPGFEGVSLPPGYHEGPAMDSWTFSGDAGIAVDEGTGDDIPPPWEGQQMAYLRGNGEISIEVTFPTEIRSRFFGVGFKAVNRERGGISDGHKVRVLFDGASIDARSFSQSNGYTPQPYDPGRPWYAKVVYWTDSDYYSTTAFEVEPGSTHTITFRGEGDADDALFLEDVRITHTDAIFDGEMPAGGDASGQINSSTYQSGLNVQNDWATAYGLHHITYEGGWSLGGDTGGSAVQNLAKYRSEEARLINARALDMFHQAGGAVNTLGTYAHWPLWSDNISVEGLLELESNPLLLGQRDVLNKLPVAPTNGTGIPNRLLPADIHLSLDAHLSGTTASIDEPGEWLFWNLLAPASGEYTCEITATGSAAFVVEVDGEVVATFPDAASLPPFTLDLRAGQRGFRLRQSGTGDLAVESVLISNPAYASAPAFTPRGGSFEYPVTVSLSSESPDATILYTLDGSEPSPEHGRLYTEPFLVSTPTTVRAAAYENGRYPSAVRSEFYDPSGNGELFAVWDFDGNEDNNPVAPVFRAVADPSILAQVGPGLLVGDYLGNGLSAYAATSNTLAEAIAGEEYFSISIAAGGEDYSLTAAEFRPFSQNRTRTFTLFSSLSGFAEENAIGSFDYLSEFGPNHTFRIDLTGHTGLAEPVELRVYIHGADNFYESVGFGNANGSDLYIHGSLDPPAPSARETWATSHGLAWDPLNDDDRDGEPLIAEYARNGDPKLADGPAEFPLTIDEAGVTFTFFRFADRTDLVYSIAASSDLKTWTDIARSSGGEITMPLSPGVSVAENGTLPVQVSLILNEPGNCLFLRQHYAILAD